MIPVSYTHLDVYKRQREVVYVSDRSTVVKAEERSSFKEIFHFENYFKYKSQNWMSCMVLHTDISYDEQ